MRKASTNEKFLDSLNLKTRTEILLNIANHYGISTSEAYAEVTYEDAECIIDYVTGGIRSTVSLFYNKFISQLK